jgi:intergrase/recombinase
MLPPPEVMDELEAILNEAEVAVKSPPKGLFGRSHKTAVEQAKKKMDDVIFRFERDYELGEEEPKSKTKSGIKKEFAQVLARPSGRGKIQMSKSQFVKEHTKLINLLTKAGKEGKEQKKELAKVLKGGRAQPRDKPAKA